MIILSSKALEISGNDTFILGEPATLTCTSVIPVDDLLWLDHEGITLFNVSSGNATLTAKKADLFFNKVNDNHHNMTFTCRAVLMGAVETNTSILVSGKFS